MPTIPNYPNLRPTALFDFANSYRVDPRIAFSRASTSTMAGPLNTMRTNLSGSPSIEFDYESGRAYGLFVGKSRTNTIIQSERMWDTTPWVVGNNLGGGAFASAVQSTEVLDIYGKTGSVTKFVRLAANDTIFARQSQNLTAGTYAVSLFLYVPVQSGLSNFSLIFDAQDTESATTPVSTSFGRWVRLKANLTVAGTRSYIDFNILANGTFTPTGFTFYAMGAQVSASVGDPPYVPTTTAAATRAADLAVLDSTSFAGIYNPVEWSIILNTRRSPLGPGIYPRYISLNGGSLTNEFLVVDQGNNTITIGAQAAGVFQGETTITNVPAEFKLGLSYKNKVMRFSMNGGTIGTFTMGTAPSGITQMDMGGSNGGIKIESTVAQVAMYAKQLTDTQLIALTTP